KVAVSRIERELVFIRPSTVVLYDRVSLVDSSYGVTFIAHALSRPTVDAAHWSVTRGASRLDADTLLPEGLSIGIADEPSKTPKYQFTENQTYTPSFRVEVTTPTGSSERRILHALQVGPAGTAMRRAMVIKGDHVEGTAVGDGASATVIV